MTTGDGGSRGDIGSGMRGGATGGDISGCNNCAICISTSLVNSGYNNGNEGDLLLTD